MKNNIQFELVSPEKKLVSEPVYLATLPATDGEMGVGAGHSSYVVSLNAGVVELYASADDKDTRRIFIAGGFADITNDNCTILAEQAVNVSELNADELSQELETLQSDLKLAVEEADQRRLSRKIDLVEAKLQAVQAV